MVTVSAHGVPIRLPTDRNSATGSAILVGVRPEKVTLLDSVDRAQVPVQHNRVDGTVTDVSYTGVSTQYLARTPWGQELTVFEQNDIVGDRAAVGDPVVMHWAVEHTFGLEP
jgi:spermidine/putrescine transport system ATP-binding protein